MSKNHIKYPKIKQLKDLIKDIEYVTRCIGKDSKGEPIIDSSIPLPKLTATGTVKLHGTNASICYNALEGLWVQSRNRIITPKDDQYNFAKFVDSNIDEIRGMVRNICVTNKINTLDYTLAIFGEWVGKGIQSKVGISEVERSFVVFGVYAVGLGNMFEIKDYTIGKEDIRIFDIRDFDSYKVSIDFNNPESAVEELTKYTLQVEENCPVSRVIKTLDSGQEGHGGIGEGIVWRVEYNNKGMRFKTKGDKHKGKPKNKKTVLIEPEKLESISKFLNYIEVETRVDKAIEAVFGNDPFETDRLGEVLKWVSEDIISEESDTLEANGLTYKDVSRGVSRIGVKYFFSLNK